MLDKSTTPPDEILQLGQHPAVIVVQNIAQTQAAMPKGTRVVVRMVNNSAAEVMAATILPGSVGAVNVENALSAGPMPIPLSYRPLSYAGSGGWSERTQGSGAEGSAFYPPQGMSRYWRTPRHPTAVALPVRFVMSG